MTDLIAGRVSMMFIDVLTGLPHVNGKALKALAALSGDDASDKSREPLRAALAQLQAPRNVGGVAA